MDNRNKRNKLWVREHKKERWMIQVMDQEASDRSRINRRIHNNVLLIMSKNDSILNQQKFIATIAGCHELTVHLTYVRTLM